MALYDLGAVTDYIRKSAAARGIDPDTAVKVARSEGLGSGIWQSNYRKNGIREPSYGPFQLLKGGSGTGFPVGMGNQFQQKTGLDPSDPKNVYAGIDFALDGAAKNGWGAWYGAAKAGVGKWDGLRGATPQGVATGGGVTVTGKNGEDISGMFNETSGGSGSSSGATSTSVPEAIDKQTAQQAASAEAARATAQAAEDADREASWDSIKDYAGRFIIVALGLVFVAGGVFMFTSRAGPARAVRKALA